jgi:hypothetical protein
MLQLLLESLAQEAVLEEVVADVGRYPLDFLLELREILLVLGLVVDIELFDVFEDLQAVPHYLILVFSPVVVLDAELLPEDLGLVDAFEGSDLVDRFVAESCAEEQQRDDVDYVFALDDPEALVD